MHGGGMHGGGMHGGGVHMPGGSPAPTASPVAATTSMATLQPSRNWSCTPPEMEAATLPRAWP